MVVGGTTAAFAKTICSICYEDLKPIVEDLQSISICGHVFHELCLQQWFEYCKNGKKKNCPVCKQACSNANVGRLYFQSIGDSNDHQCVSPKPSDSAENPEELRNEISRLEGKVSGLSSALDQQQKSCEASNDELFVLKERLKVEEALRKEALNQSETILKMIHLKSEELDQSTMECMRLQNRNMALAKELAALKLASDLNLDEDDVLKLACLGNDANSKESVDVLKKSLVIRNKSYKELMAKCNMLGRREARSLAELKKAQEKIKKLKERVQELESVKEANDNEVLRRLKSSGATTYATNAVNNGFQTSIKTGVFSVGDQNKASSLPDTNMAIENNKDDYSSSTRKKRKLETSGLTSHAGIVEEKVARKSVPDNLVKGPLLITDDENARESSAPALSHRHCMPSPENGGELWKSNSRKGDQESDAHVQEQGEKDKMSGVIVVIQAENEKKASIVDDDVIVIDADISLSKTFNKVNKETPPPVVTHSGDPCFAPGLLGPDGAKWHLGKWCKRAHSKGQSSLNTGLQSSSTSSKDLIAVGADGRGGRIKILRSLNQPSLDNKRTPTSIKANQRGAKSSTLKSHRSTQIDEFFGRASKSKKF